MQFDLEVPQFPAHELLACAPGLSSDAFKQWIQRRAVVLSTVENPGRGRKQLYRGTDVVQVAAIHELIRQGMQANKATIAWQTVIQNRLIAWRTGFAEHEPPYGRAVFFAIHHDTDELVAQEFSEGVDDPLDHPDAPDVLILFRTDRFIRRMIERMQRVKAGGATGETKAPARPSAFIGWDELEAQGKLETDAQGRRVMIGLTHAETIQWLRLTHLDMYERMGGPSLYASPEDKDDAREHKLKLEEKHRIALTQKTVTTAP